MTYKLYTTKLRDDGLYVLIDPDGKESSFPMSEKTALSYAKQYNDAIRAKKWSYQESEKYAGSFNIYDESNSLVAHCDDEQIAKVIVAGVNRMEHCIAGEMTIRYMLCEATCPECGKRSEFDLKGIAE